MRTLVLASTMLALVAGSSLAATTVTMTLEMGGSNHGADCVFHDVDPADGVNDTQYYTRGTDTSPQVINGEVTWDVVIEASGSDGLGGDTRGVANFVFDLELYDEFDQLITAADFYSTTNGVNCSDPNFEDDNPTYPEGFVTNAAFAYSFYVNFKGPGRVFDSQPGGLVVSGGPRMDVHTYPNEPSTGDDVGKLLGMGAGYSDWYRGAIAGNRTSAGVGQTGAAGQACDPTWGCIGVGPVAEGQLDLSALGVGTYKLKLVPGSGINVLRSDTNFTVSQSVFAVAANTVSPGNEIVFYWGGAVVPCQITSWGSEKVNGGYGPQLVVLDPLAIDADVISEPRMGGVEKIIVEFNKDMTGEPISGTIQAVNQLDLSPVDATSASFTGSKLTIEFAGGLPEECYLIDLAGNIGCLTGDSDCLFRSLVGDTNNTGNVSLQDMVEIKLQLDAPPLGPPGGDIAGLDVNLTGTISLQDMVETKLRLDNVVGASNCR